MVEAVEERPAPAGAPEDREWKKERIRDRRALALLLSLVLFLLLMPVLAETKLGGLLLVLLLYSTLVTSIRELASLTGRKQWILPTVLLAGISMTFILLSHVMQTRSLSIANQSLLIVFFGLIAAGLFLGLGQPGSITAGRLYTSVSLYLILGMVWFAVYRLIDAVSPGSFMVAGAIVTGPMPRSTLLYLSFVTLTTVGYGDVVPVAPLARMLATMEAAAGVLYVAITVARLVSSYQGTGHRHG
jgi:voltage-gated potassium channel